MTDRAPHNRCSIPFGDCRTPAILHGFIWTLILVTIAGCMHPRSFWRQQADESADYLIEQKKSPECWPLEDHSIHVDPSSRMFDPFDLDCPPMPPDDPASHELMHCVDGKSGYQCWHANGETPYVENSDWWSLLPRSEEGSLKIDVSTAMQLALTHSPEYQRALEELYLSALDVSFERFRFDDQYFAGYSGFLNFLGDDRNSGESSSTLELSTFSDRGGDQLLRQKLFTSGGEFAVGLANSLIWEFSGRDTHMASSLIDFSLIQPLLRHGGRDVVMERLTQSERNLLANVRQMERFRRSFYVQVVAGRDADTGPSRNGLTVGGGLSGFTTTSGQAGGYLGILQSLQDIRNQRANIAALQSSLSQLDAFFIAGRIDFFQVELARQALYSAQSRLLTSERALEASIDTFKITLGLPPYLEMDFDDEPIRPFELVDMSILPLQDRLTLLQQEVGNELSQLFDNAILSQLAVPINVPELPVPLVDLSAENSNQDEPIDDVIKSGDRDLDDQQDSSVTSNDASPKSDRNQTLNRPTNDGPTRQTLEWSPEVKSTLSTLGDHVAEILQAITEARDKHLEIAKRDTERLKSAIPDRNESADKLRQQIRQRLARERVEQGIEKVTAADIEGVLPFNAERLRQLPTVLDNTIKDVAKQLDTLEESFNEIDGELKTLLEQGESLPPTALYERLQERIRLRIPSQLNRLAATVLSLTLVEARARTESTVLPSIETTWQVALETARTRRLDWMNARSSLVDAWRQIQFSANDLESQLDFVIEGDIGNVGDNSLDIRLSNSRLRFGLEFDAAITRLQERNTYREAQIRYQQARRAFYQYEDGVAYSLRDIVRRLEINQINFEIQRAAVEVAISQVELTRLRLQEPPRPNEQSSFGATTARDLVQALQGLLSVQNDFLDVWIQQEVLRRLLDLDRGTMQLDADGLWIDGSQEIDSEDMTPDDVDAPSDSTPTPLPQSDIAETATSILNRKPTVAIGRDQHVRPASIAVPVLETDPQSLQPEPTLPPSRTTTYEKRAPVVLPATPIQMPKAY